MEDREGGVEGREGGVEGREEVENLSMECAVLCLRNVLLCLQEMEEELEKSPSNSTSTPPSNSNLPSSSPSNSSKKTLSNTSETVEVEGGGPVMGLGGTGWGGGLGLGLGMSKRQIWEVRSVVNLNLSYIMLLRKNATSSLYYSNLVLSSPFHTEAHSFVANVYAAEAHCLLNDCEASLLHLNSANLHSSSSSLEDSESDFYFPPSSDTTGDSSLGGTSNINNKSSKQFSLPFKRILYTNLVSVCISKGQWEKAEQYLSQALSISSAPTVELLLLEAYLLLKKEEVGKALELLRKGRPLPRRINPKKNPKKSPRKNNPPPPQAGGSKKNK